MACHQRIHGGGKLLSRNQFLIYFKDNNESITLNKTDKLLYDCIFIGLTTDRDNLYSIINNRVDLMIKDGLESEVKAFYDSKVVSKPLTSGIGYREFYEYFSGNITYNECIDKIKQDSRHYAKRQYTFFNNQLPIKWFNTNYDNFNDTIEKIAEDMTNHSSEYDEAGKLVNATNLTIGEVI